MSWFRSAVSAFLFLILAGYASAQDQALHDQVSQQTVTLSGIDDTLSGDAKDLDAAQAQLVSEIDTAQELVDALTVRKEEVERRLEWLGPAIEGEASESAQQRSDLNARLAEIEASLDQARRNAAEIRRLESEIYQKRRETRLEQAFSRTSSVLQPALLGDALNNAQRVSSSISADVAAWSNRDAPNVRTNLAWLVLIGVVVLTAAATAWLRSMFRKPIDQHIAASLVDMQSGAILGVLYLFSRVIPAVIAAFIVYQAIFLLGLASDAIAPLLRNVFLVLIGVSIVNAAANSFIGGNTVFPKKGDLFRLNKLWIRASLTLSALVLGADFLLVVLLSPFESISALHSVRQAVTALLLCGFTLVLLIKEFWVVDVEPETSEEGEAPSGKPVYAVNAKWLSTGRILVRMLTIAIIGLALIGYTPLAHGIMVHSYLLIAAGFVIFLVREVIHELTRIVFGRLRKTQVEASDEDDILLVWTDILFDGVILLISIPVALLLIGFDWLDLTLMGKRLLDGFSIGNQRFSLAQLFIGILVFILLIGVTRFVQRTADRRVLSRMRVDEGVSNSLKMLIGYVGLVIAFMTGISMAGFDLSNLAIIAGALSVGIGFGLQSIVNNFVSGLILLFERPIKVGDWVVTTSGEGIVKRISVRSTEIETFDRSSIIVPNSELISSSVTNWTHKNRLGRVTIPVGVSYNEDPDKILEILAGIPERVEIILNYPEPLILFTGFGDSSLDFEIRAFIADVSNSLKARTALRVAIFKAFREEGVEIPFPQRDLHLRGVEDKILGKMSEINHSEDSQ